MLESLSENVINNEIQLCVWTIKIKPDALSMFTKMQIDCVANKTNFVGREMNQISFSRKSR